jgi:hypothetical protein
MGWESSMHKDNTYNTNFLKPISVELRTSSPLFMENHFHHHVHKRPPVDPILNQKNSSTPSHPYFFHIYSSIILKFMPYIPKCPLPLMKFCMNFTYLSCLLYVQLISDSLTWLSL